MPIRGVRRPTPRKIPRREQSASLAPSFSGAHNLRFASVSGTPDPEGGGSTVAKLPCKLPSRKYDRGRTQILTNLIRF